jgi:uncharacterized protein (DUF885 family)
MNLAPAYNRSVTRFSHAVALGLAFFGLAGCGAPRAPVPAPAPNDAPNANAPNANANAPPERVSRIVERYWDERAPLGNELAPQSLADSLAVERRFLAELLAIPRDPLNAESRLTYDIFRRQREQDIEALTYPAELLPINPFDGPPLDLARAAADMAEYPLKTAQDYANWLLRIEHSVRWMRQAIANMREGMGRGYTSPRALMERALPLLQGLGADTTANVFYVPLGTLPEAIKDPERTRLSVALNHAVRDQLLPGIRELHDFIQSDYLLRTRLSVALAALPLGTSWYASLVRRATDSPLTPSEIHGIGSAEVERIRARLQALPAPPPAVGSIDPLTAYRDLKIQTLAAVPGLFSALPQADFEIRAAGVLGDAGAAVSYQRAATDGATPAILYVNMATGARPATVDIAQFLQEALPGRHVQSALQQENADLPKFRRWGAPRFGAPRFGGAPGFVQGWALYAASLGEELGLYRDDEARRGAASAQLKCAAALVVDTGLHAKGWTRAQAVEYLRAQLALDDAGASLMTDRFVAEPAEALACKMGELKFQALRGRAQQVLGAKFDYREYHSEVLKDGAMPLDILDARLQAWMEAQR